MKQRFLLFIIVIASLIATQCGGTPPATEAPAPTKAPPTEAPATEAPTATEVPPTEVPATEAPTATEIPPTEVPATEAPTATEVPPTEVPATEAPTATEIPPTEVPATEAPTATEIPPTEAPTATKAPPTEAPATLEGKSLLQERCTVCHDLGRVERSKKTQEEWKATVERMVGKGAQLDEAEQERLIKYLTETYPK